MSDSLNIEFVFPIDGDCININDGVSEDGGIKITAVVSAPTGHNIEIQGIKAECAECNYCAEVIVKAPETVLVAKDYTTGEIKEIKVFVLADPMNGFRLSSDDNIIFLCDINDNKDKYKSIFENPYLAVYKKAHDLYGAKAHINLFYEFDDEAKTHFSKPRKYFNLSMMTDKFKDEFIKNSDWLKFTFHAKSEFPDKPYKFATAEKVVEDCIKVHREIERFAGKEVMSETTTVHWGEANKEVAVALRRLGYKNMTGYFIPGDSPVAYYFSDEMIEYIYGRDFFFDTETAILFGRIDLVLNCGTNSGNLEMLEEIMKSPQRGGFVSVMIHEQYFYDDYENYLPDFEERVLEACKLIHNNGYEGRFISEVR